MPRSAARRRARDPRDARALRLRVGRADRAPVGAHARLYAAALARLRATGDVYACACTRRELETRAARRRRRARLPGHVPRRHSGGPRATRAARRACASATRAIAFARPAAGRADAGPRARRRRFRRPPRRRSLRVPARGRRRRCAARASPTSCAAPTCSPRRRARSCCSGCSAIATPSYLHVPVAINAARRKALEADARARRCRTIRCRRCSPRGASSISRCPTVARRRVGRRVLVVGAAPRGMPARLPPVRDAAGAGGAPSARTAEAYNYRFSAAPHRSRCCAYRRPAPPTDP